MIKRALDKIRLRTLGQLASMVILVTFSSPGCCYWSHTCKDPSPILQDGVDCTKAAIASALPSIFPEVLAALASGDWSTLLTALEVDGADLVECAVDKAAHDIGPQPQPTSGPSSMMAEAPAELQRKVLYAQMSQNAQTYLTKKGVKIAKHAK